MFHEKYTVTSVEMCTLMNKRSDIRDLEFKVRIPRLMTNVKQMPSAAPQDKPVMINISRFLNGHKAYKVKSKIDTSNYIVAITMTDYRGTMKIPLHQNKDMWTPEGELASITGTPDGTSTIFDQTKLGIPVIPPHAHWIMGQPFNLSSSRSRNSLNELAAFQAVCYKSRKIR